MSTTLRNLTVGIVANAKPLEAGLRGAGQKVRSFASSLLGGIGVTFIGKELIDLASDAQEMNSKLDAVWENSATQARQWADSTAEAIGRSSNEVRSFHSEMGDLFQPMGFAREEAMKLSSQVVTLAYDLASFNNLADSEALDRLRGTLVGSHENALKFGVVINESTLKLELMAMGARKVNGEFSVQDKVMARLNLLMKGTTAAHGDAARTLGGFANSLKALQGQAKDLGAELGSALLPSVTAVVQSVSFFVKVLKALAIDKVALGVGLTAAAFAGFVLLSGRVIAAFVTIKKAIDAVTKSQIIAQAFSGPKGWAVLAAGAVVAGVAIYGVNKAMEETAVAAQSSAAAVSQSTVAAKDNATATEAQVKAQSEYLAALIEKRDALGLEGLAADQATGKLKNFTEEAVAMAQKLHAQIAGKQQAEEAAKAYDDLIQKGKELTESFRTPAEQQQALLEKYRDWALQGIITWDTYHKAIAKANEELQAQNDIKPFQSPSALEKGSAGAFQAIAEARGTEKMRLLQERQLAEAEKQTAIQETIASNSSSSGSSRPVITVVQF